MHSHTWRLWTQIDPSRCDHCFVSLSTMERACYQGKQPLLKRRYALPRVTLGNRKDVGKRHPTVREGFWSPPMLRSSPVGLEPYKVGAGSCRGLRCSKWWPLFPCSTDRAVHGRKTHQSFTKKNTTWTRAGVCQGSQSMVFEFVRDRYVIQSTNTLNDHQLLEAKPLLPSVKLRWNAWPCISPICSLDLDIRLFPLLRKKVNYTY